MMRMLPRTVDLVTVAAAVYGFVTAGFWGLLTGLIGGYLVTSALTYPLAFGPTHRARAAINWCGSVAVAVGCLGGLCCWTPGSAQFWTGDGDHEVGLDRGVFRVSSAARRR